MLRRGLIGGASAAILARAALAQVGPVGGPVGMQFPRSGPGGYGGPGPGAASVGTPSLDINFVDGSAFDPRITYTGSGGTFFNAAGAIVAATTNVPRIDYDPVTHAIRGLLIEEARTNLLLNSATLVTQSVTVTAQAYTLSFYGTGTVTLSGVSTAGPLVGTGAFPTRAAPLTFTPTAGTLTLTVTGSVLNAQLEAGASRTSWISTAGASVTRTVDAPTMPTGAWLSATSGTLACEFMPIVAPSIATVSPVSFDDTTSVNRIIIGSTLTGSIFGTSIISSVSTATVGTVNLYSAGAVSKAALSYQASGMLCALNAGSATSGAAATVPPLTTLRLGRNVTGSGTLNGYIRRVRYWPRALSGSELQVATT